MDKDFRAVILHGFSNADALAIMRAVKSLSPGTPSPAFATTTPANLGWKLEDLLAQLAEEHAAARKRVAEV